MRWTDLYRQYEIRNVLLRVMAMNDRHDWEPPTMSQIDNGFKQMLDGMKLADEGRDQVMRGLETMWDGRKDLDAQLAALRNDLAQTRETIAALEAVVFEQSGKIDALQRRLEEY